MAKNNNTKNKEMPKLPYFQYGSMIFGIGLVIAIIGSLLKLEQETIRIVIVTEILFGVIIGLINITKKETKAFLIASTSLILITSPFITVQAGTNIFGISMLQFLAQTLFNSQQIYNYFINFMLYFLSMIISATIIVALKTIIMTAKDEN